MNEADLPNPFETARRIVGVNVLLKPSDIVVGERCSTVKQAERLIDAHGAAIAAAMLAAGIKAAGEIINHEGMPE